MGTRLHPLKDALRMTRRTRKSLKKQMTRWLRRGAKSRPQETLRTRRHKGYWW